MGVGDGVSVGVGVDVGVGVMVGVAGVQAVRRMRRKRRKRREKGEWKVRIAGRKLQVTNCRLRNVDCRVCGIGVRSVMAI